MSTQTPTAEVDGIPPTNAIIDQLRTEHVAKEKTGDHILRILTDYLKKGRNKLRKEEGNPVTVEKLTQEIRTQMITRQEYDLVQIKDSCEDILDIDLSFCKDLREHFYLLAEAVERKLGCFVLVKEDIENSQPQEIAPESTTPSTPGVLKTPPPTATETELEDVRLPTPRESFPPEKTEANSASDCEAAPEGGAGYNSSSSNSSKKRSHPGGKRFVSKSKRSRVSSKVKIQQEDGDPTSSEEDIAKRPQRGRGGRRGGGVSRKERASITTEVQPTADSDEDEEDENPDTDGQKKRRGTPATTREKKDPIRTSLSSTNSSAVGKSSTQPNSNKKRSRKCDDSTVLADGTRRTVFFTQGNWCCRWVMPNGTRKTKSFACAKWGHDEAKRLAIAAELDVDGFTSKKPELGPPTSGIRTSRSRRSKGTLEDQQDSEDDDDPYCEAKRKNVKVPRHPYFPNSVREMLKFWGENRTSKVPQLSTSMWQAADEGIASLPLEGLTENPVMRTLQELEQQQRRDEASWRKLNSKIPRSASPSSVESSGTPLGNVGSAVTYLQKFGDRFWNSDSKTGETPEDRVTHFIRLLMQKSLLHGSRVPTTNSGLDYVSETLLHLATDDDLIVLSGMRSPTEKEVQDLTFWDIMRVVKWLDSHRKPIPELPTSSVKSEGQ